jgi:iron complex outermembrane receptor protein
MLSGYSLWAQEETSDTIFSKTLSPVSVYAIKGKPLGQRTKLSHADWVQHDAGQVLQHIPGFNVIKKSGSFGFDPVFRGFKLEQLGIVNNGGLTAAAACPNRMDPPTSQVMINQVEEIEVLKGPHNFRYGPSTGAVINFKTAQPRFSEKSEIFGRINAGVESNGFVMRTEGMAGIRTKKLQMSAAISYSDGNDYQDGQDSIIPATFNRGALNLNAAYKLKEGHIATVNVTRNFARNTDFPTLMMDLLSDDTWMLQGEYLIKSVNRWYSNWTTQIFSSWVDHQMGNRLRPASLMMLSHVQAETRVMGGRTEFTVKNRNATYFIGGDVKYEFANGVRSRTMKTQMMEKTFLDTLWQQGFIVRTGLFADARWNTGRNEWSLSGRFDLVHAQPQTAAQKFSQTYTDLYSTDLNPSISSGISRKLTDAWSLGAWLGVGVRSGGLTEKFINFLPVGLDAYEVLGNPQIKPEANTQLDVVARYERGKTVLQLNGFASYIHQFISTVVDPTMKPMLPTSPGVRRYINIDEASMLGFEFLWTQKWNSTIAHDLSAAYVRGQNLQLDQPLPEISPFEIRYRLNGSFLKNLMQPYAALRYSFAQNRVSEAFAEKTTENFMVMDIGLKIVPRKNIQVNMAVQNLLDETYREHLSRFIRPGVPLNSPGVSFVLMVSYSF